MSELHVIWEVHFGTLVLALHCYSGDKIQNTDFFQITCFKENKNMMVEQNLSITINTDFQLSWNKKHLSKQVVPITDKLEKRLFAVATFEGLWVLSFQTEYKTCKVLWSGWIFFGFSEKRRPQRTVFINTVCKK